MPNPMFEEEATPMPATARTNPMLQEEAAAAPRPPRAPANPMFAEETGGGNPMFQEERSAPTPTAAPAPTPAGGEPIEELLRLGKLAGASEQIRGAKRIKRETSLFGKYVRGIGEGLSQAAPPEERAAVEETVQKNIVRQSTPPGFPPEKAKRIGVKEGRLVLDPFRHLKGPPPRLAPPPPRLREETRTPQEIVLQEPKEEGEVSALGKIGIVLGTPFRGLGGFAKGTQEAFQYMANNWDTMSQQEGLMLREYIMQRMGRSMTNEIPVFLGDLNLDAIRAITGKRDVTKGEWALAQGLGFVEDLLVGGKLFPGMRQGPKGLTVGKQLRGALKKAGATPGQLSDFERLGQYIMAAETHPERVSAAHRMLRRMAKKHGVDPKVTDRLLTKKIGQEGGALGETGLKGLVERGSTEPRKIPPLGIGRAPRAGEEGAALATELERAVPPGARYAGRLGIPRLVAQEARYGAGAAKGAAEALRPAQSYEAMSEYLGLRGGRELEAMLGKRNWFVEKIFGKKSRSKEFSKMRDARSILAREQKSLAGLQDELIGMTDAKAASEVQAQIVQKQAGVEMALGDLELTREQVAAGYRFSPGKRGVQERQAMKGFHEEMLNMKREADALGIELGEIEQYIPRIETPESKARRLIQYGAEKVGIGKPSFAKERLGEEAGVSLAGTGLREFEQGLGEIYRTRKRLQGIAVSNVMAEEQLLQQFGREIPPGWRNSKTGQLLPEAHASLKAQGLAQYKGTAGPLKGRDFVIDEGSAKLLERVTNPGKIEQALKLVDRIHAWWKPRVTVTKLGFTARNFGGNLLNMWMADVDMVRSMQEALVIQSLRRAKGSPVGYGSYTASLVDDMVKNVAGKDLLTGKSIKIGKYTPEQVRDLAEQYKIFGRGQAGYEFGTLGGVGEVMKANPWSRNFLPVSLNARLNTGFENNAALSIFSDRLRKGFQPWEAADDVAKYIFRYDELSKTGGIVLRNVMPFGTWTYKNWGLQAWSLMEKPDKMGKFLRAYEGIQHMDPLTLAEEQTERMMGPEKGKKLIARVPFARGPQGERLQFMLGGYAPQASLNQLAPSELAGEIGGMLSPIFDVFGELKEEKQKQPFPGYWYTFSRQKKGPFRTAPTWVNRLMESAEGTFAHRILGKVFKPEYDPIRFQQNLSAARAFGMEDKEAWEWAGENTQVLRYKWDAEIPDVLQQVDPGMMIINKLFRASDEQNKDELINFLTGIKLRPYGLKQADVDWRREIDEAIKELDEAKKRSLQTGKRLPERNPLRGFYP